MSANSSTALTSMMKRFSMSLLLILILSISYAKGLESGQSAESSEPEIRAALCDLEKRDFVNAQKRIEAVLKSDPDNISAQKVFLGILAR